MRIGPIAAALAALVATNSALAQPYRCTVAGQTSYSDRPCDLSKGGGTQSQVDIVDNTTDSTEHRRAAARMKREEAFARARARQAAEDGGGSSMSGSSQACTQAKRSYEVEASSITRNLNAIRARQQEVEAACNARSPTDANHAKLEQAEQRRQERIAAGERAQELSRSQFNNARVLRCDRGGCDTTAGRISGGDPNALSAPGGSTCRLMPGGGLSCP